MKVTKITYGADVNTSLGRPSDTFLSLQWTQQKIETGLSRKSNQRRLKSNVTHLLISYCFLAADCLLPYIPTIYILEKYKKNESHL